MRSFASVCLVASLSAPLLASAATPGGAPGAELDRFSNDVILSFQGIEPVLDATNGLELAIGPSDLNITVGAAPAGDLAILVEGVSTLDWEADTEAVLFHQLQPLPNGGNVGFDGAVDLYVDLTLLGSSFPLFGISLPFEATSEGFGSFVLAGDGDTALDLSITSNELDFEESFGVADLLQLAIGFDLSSIADAGVTVYGYPVSTVVASGRHLDSQINGEVYRLENTQSFVPVFLDDAQPRVEAQTTYSMQTTASMGYTVGLEGYVQILGGALLDLDIGIWEQTLQLFADSRAVNYNSPPYDHGLPMASLSATEVGFGELTLGGSDVFEIPLENLGDMELQGAITFEGSDAFKVSPNELFIGSGTEQSILVTFAPTSPGEHIGFLMLETNDPMMPFVELPLTGRAAQDPNDPDGDGVSNSDNGLFQPAERSSIYSACGCSSQTSPTGSLAWLGLMGGLVFLRRQRS